MIRREGERLVVSGPVNLGNVAELLAQGAQGLRSGASALDFAEVTELDSALVAAALAWLREARREHRALRFLNLPPGLVTIARLYGVAELLPGGANPH